MMNETMNETMRDLATLKTAVIAELVKLLPELDVAKEAAYTALYEANEADIEERPEADDLYEIFDELDEEATALNKKTDLLEDTLTALRELKDKLTDLTELYK